MKNLLTILLLFYLNANATTYYFSATGSNAANGTSTVTPWQTIAKFNSVFASLSPGDFVLFKKGDTFYGGLTISRSGSAGLPITIGAYGSGANPIITGFTTVSAWTNLGSNIWESTSAVSTLTTAKVVVINGVNTAMGRYPNTGYLTYQTFSTNTSITSSSLNSATTNWTGAEVVIKKQRWIINRYPITAHSGGTLTYSGGGTYVGQNGWGFFIQADSRTMDVQNEWYYNTSTKKIRVYSTSSPTNVQISTVGDLVYMVNRSYITFDNISFSGANGSGIYFGSGTNLIIQNCSIDFCYYGLWGQNWGFSSANFQLLNSTVNHSNNNGVDLPDEATSATVTGNTIQNSAVFPGMGGNGDGQHEGMIVAGNSSLVQYNTVDNSGYNGIAIGGNSMTISNNFVTNFCLIKDDGGGVYSYGTHTGNIISYNTILNGIGNDEGTVNPGYFPAYGIYIDGNVSSGVQLLNNSIANIGDAGILLHNSNNEAAKYNTVYNSIAALLVQNDYSGSYIRNLDITDNIFFAKTSTQLALHVATLYNDISSFGIFDRNYYARPIDDNLTIRGNPNGAYASPTNYYSLATWKTYSGLDASSNKSPKTITDVNDLRFEYNETGSNKTVSLPYNYIDVKGVAYNGTITLAPYTSAVLIKNVAITSGKILIHGGKILKHGGKLIKRA